ncbi:DUF6894 family protein [Sphingomonas sp. RS2018]
MATFHINVRTGSHIATTLTVDKADHAELRLEMARFVGELLTKHAAQIWADEDWQVDVSDETGLILYAMQVSASKTPATAGLVL